MKRLLALLGTLVALNAAPLHAALDVRNTERVELDNGLTVLLLRDRSFPLVSVQMLYRAGARDEVPGRTGLAHFVEHIAFRSSKNFPDNGLVNSIYAVGGEWHGYTYLDQTTYFATAAREHLELLLRIEADRLHALDIDPANIPAERGAVLAEMHGYENDPAAVLHDATVAQAFLAHPYRNNTIGWESDVRAIGHNDVVDFYRQHYRASNAVLAVVGDFDRDDALTRITQHFAALPDLPPTPLPDTVEPPQTGERRITLRLPSHRQHFQIVWRAPPATSGDFAAFLLLQELLGGGDGVNFLHNEWGTPVRADAPLADAADDVRTFMMPTAQPYVFAIKGSTPHDANRGDIEKRIQAAIEPLRAQPVLDRDLAAAKERVLDALLLDVQTTEDAAHQLAFFEGLHALDMLQSLPARIDAVAARDVRRVAEQYLGAGQRTIGWVLDGEPTQPMPPAPPPNIPAGTPAPPGVEPAAAMSVHGFENTLPLLLQPSPLSDTAHLALVVRGHTAREGFRAAHPVPGRSTYERTVPGDELPAAIDAAAAALEMPHRPVDESPASDPYSRMEQVFASLLPPPPPGPVELLVVTGRFDPQPTVRRLMQAFSDMDAAPQALNDLPPVPDMPPVIHERIGRPLAQAQLGYAVRAPAPNDPDADTWRALLYVLSHDYGGRLGDEAISRRGLVYYIDARYRSDGERGLVTLSASVDPGKLDAMEDVLRAELERLRTDPPDAAEIEEALNHRIGRAISAAQSNHELADTLINDWSWYGKQRSPDALRKHLQQITPADVAAVVDAFRAGTFITVTE